MTLEQLVKTYEQKAIKYGKDAHAIRWLIMELSGLSPSEFYMQFKKEVPTALISKIKTAYEAYVKNHIPVQHIVGYTYFYGYKFLVNEHVLIPRRETEQLVEESILLYDKYFNQQPVDVLDLGTGSGAIGITLSIEVPEMKVMATDISIKALEVARQNQLNLSSRVHFKQSDWFLDINQTFDMIIANPPYIPNDEAVEDIVLKEPKIALFGGESGLEPYEIILKEAKNYLKEKSIIAFEHSMYQKDNLRQLILKYFSDANIIQLQDMQGKDRMTFVGLGGIFDA